MRTFIVKNDVKTDPLMTSQTNNSFRWDKVQKHFHTRHRFSGLSRVNTEHVSVILVYTPQEIFSLTHPFPRVHCIHEKTNRKTRRGKNTLPYVDESLFTVIPCYPEWYRQKRSCRVDWSNCNRCKSVCPWRCPSERADCRIDPVCCSVSGCLRLDEASIRVWSV